MRFVRAPSFVGFYLSLPPPTRYRCASLASAAVCAASPSPRGSSAAGGGSTVAVSH
ncbi:hypothetical protein ACP70R_002511 [Stipagrostis hirtigluma subsp. patula]